MGCAECVLENSHRKENCQALLKQAGSEFIESMNYPVSDFIIRLKNAGLARRRRLVAPYYKITKGIAAVLLKEGFLEEIKEKTMDGKKSLEITLKYEKRIPVLTDVTLISKPSLRRYSEVKGIPEIQKRGRHTVILSTNKGIMTGRQAIKNKVGGEVLFKVW